MFRLAHISDIHLGPLPRITPRELASKRITGYVNWHRHRRKRLFGNILESLMTDIKTAAPDHLAMTGDMVNLAAAAEIEAIKGWLRAAGDPADISLVPGNHDAYVPGAFRKICAAWQPYMMGDDGRLSASGDHLFPFLRKRGKVALIGVSTAAATPPFMASGILGSRQARRLAALLEESAGLFRIVLIHHPPVRGATSQYKRMLGIGRFSKVLRKSGAELVLHGHTHLDSLHWLAGKDTRVPVVGVPSASEAPGGKRPASGYNLITIDETQGGWATNLQRFGLDTQTGKFKLASETDLSDIGSS
jgi:3',5'-cyclic AMP phosphodiesterase CpdA